MDAPFWFLLIGLVLGMGWGLLLIGLLFAAAVRHAIGRGLNL